MGAGSGDLVGKGSNRSLFLRFEPLFKVVNPFAQRQCAGHPCAPFQAVEQAQDRFDLRVSNFVGRRRKGVESGIEPGKELFSLAREDRLEFGVELIGCLFLCWLWFRWGQVGHGGGSSRWRYCWGRF
jgi:hypothetical protein